MESGSMKAADKRLFSSPQEGSRSGASRTPVTASASGRHTKRRRSEPPTLRRVNMCQDMLQKHRRSCESSTCETCTGYAAVTPCAICYDQLGDDLAALWKCRECAQYLHMSCMCEAVKAEVRKHWPDLMLSCPHCRAGVPLEMPRDAQLKAAVREARATVVSDAQREARAAAAAAPEAEEAAAAADSVSASSASDPEASSSEEFSEDSSGDDELVEEEPPHEASRLEEGRWWWDTAQRAGGAQQE